MHRPRECRCGMRWTWRVRARPARMTSFHQLVFKRTNSYLNGKSTDMSFSRAIEGMAA